MDKPKLKIDHAEIESLIIKAAELFRLDANLVRAIVAHESNGNPYAIRFEPWSYHIGTPSGVEKYFLHARDYAAKIGITMLSEEHLQSAGIGLMQVQGFKAREQGFSDNLLWLTNPAIGLFYGCKELRRLGDIYGVEEKVIAAYNAGSVRYTAGMMYVNQVYVDAVYRHLRALRGLDH